MKNFIDLEPNLNDVDKEKDDQQRAVKFQKYLPYINKAHVMKYHVRWSDPCGIDAKEHKAYLDKMAVDFYNRCLRRLPTLE